MAAPDTLPADFFDKQGASSAPSTLPADFKFEDHAAPAERTWMDSAKDYAKGVWNNLSQAGEGMVNAVKHPVDTLAGIGSAQDALRLKAEDAFKKGDYATGARHVLEYALPVVGPQVSQLGDEAQSGNVAHALGGATALGLQLAGPGALAEPSTAAAVGGAMQDAGQAVVRGTKAAGAGVRAAAPDVAIGGAKLAAGTAAAELPLGPVKYMLAYGPARSGLRQVGRGLSKGYQAAKASYAADAAPEVTALPPKLSPNVATEANPLPPEVIADLMRESEAPPAAPPNTPGLPPRMAGANAAAPEAAAQPPWYQEEGQRLFDEAKQRGIVDKIEELAGKRYTANETAADPTIKDALKGFGEGDFKGHDQVTLVRAVRNKLGIPSMDDAAEFNKWIQGRNAGPGTPSGEAPIIPVGPKAAAPVNGNPRMQSYVYEPEDVEPTASKGMPGAVEEPLQQMAKNASDQEMAAPLKADQAKYEAAQKAAADKGKAIQSGRQDIRAQKMADYMKAQGYHTPEQAQMLEQSPQLWESIGENAGVLKPSKVTIGKAKAILGWD